VPVPEAGELELFERGGFEALFAAAERHQVPIFAWFPGRAHLLEPTLQKFPNLQLILDHCGVSRSEGEHAAQLDGVFALARYPNLALKWCPVLCARLDRADRPGEGVDPRPLGAHHSALARGATIMDLDG